MHKLILAGAIASMLVGATSASAKIVLNQSVAGVSMGMSEAQVVALLGPAKRTSNTTDQITGQPLRELEYNSLYTQFIGDKVVYVFTLSRKEKTASGVGPGTKETTLKKRVSGVRCVGKKPRVCTKGSGKPGTVVTGFTIANKKVRGVGVGIVLD